jgi:hypothetical protein
VDVLYNPTVGAKIMLASFASTYFDNETLAPIVKTYRIAPRIRLEGLGILQDISLYHEQTEISLDFHVFDIKDFDVMIGRPLEKLLPFLLLKLKTQWLNLSPILTCPRRSCWFCPLIHPSHP